MTAPNLARLEARPFPTLTGLEVEGEGHSQSARVSYGAASSFAVYFLPPALSPALLALPSGAGLLILPDWTDPQAHAYRVPAGLLEDVRRGLDLRPLFSEDVTP